MIASKIKEELGRGVSLSVVDFVNCILQDAFFMHASDVHMHPAEQNVRIRFRIDGILYDVALFSSHIYQEIVSRIKILSNLRTDEHRAPQDGRFRHKAGETVFDVRVSCVPTHHGESVVLRLLTKTALCSSLCDLGFSATEENHITQAIKKQWGMILVTGPTGSGKTTTLYTLVGLLNTTETSIVTIEDPIEYALPGVKQIQTQPRAGLTFAHGLRSVLRQDPDIIMVGEIRDSETANIAIHTALTGHLLLSTIHTVDAATAVPRLLDMNIEPFLVASTLRVVVAQRLVRKVCAHCKEERVLSDREREMCKGLYGYDLRGAWRGVGCDHCKGSGFDRRIVVGEVLVVNDAIQQAVIARRDAAHIKRLALENGMMPIIHDGLRKVEAGLTTIEEVLRCLHE